MYPTTVLQIPATLRPDLRALGFPLMQGNNFCILYMQMLEQGVSKTTHAVC
jgi:hypothetical protein